MKTKIITIVVCSMLLIAGIVYTCDYRVPSESISDCDTVLTCNLTVPTTNNLVFPEEITCSSAYQVKQFPSDCITTDERYNCNSTNAQCSRIVNCYYSILLSRCEQDISGNTNRWSTAQFRFAVACGDN